MRSLRLQQGKVVALMFAGYGALYFCRADLSVGAPLIVDQLTRHGMNHDDAIVRIGTISSLGVLAYALGKLFLGGLGDYWGGRTSFLVGLAGATIFTLQFAAGSTIPVFMIAWFGNRLTQSIAWAGLIKVSSKWFDYSSYGMILGILSLSYLVGDAAARQTMGVLIENGFSWQTLFCYAAAVTAILYAANWFLLRESRVESGFPEARTNPLSLFASAESRVPGVRALLGPLMRSRAFILVCLLSLGCTIIRETFNASVPGPHRLGGCALDADDVSVRRHSPISSIGFIKRVSATPDALAVEWADGTIHEFAGIWLRDNLPEHRDPHSGQRLVDIADLPALPRIRSAAARGGGVYIEWDGEARESSFDLEWLASQAEITRRPELTVRHWLEGSALAASDFASAGFVHARDDRVLRLEWLTRLLQDGVAFLSEAPPGETGILEAMKPVGQVAETNYGLVFDVRSVPQPENLAFSDLGLGLHTDNPYREPVPGFQALHALIVSPDGGDSLFADGFALAEHVRETHPDDFALLSRTAVPFHYRSPNAELYAERPLIQLSCRGEVTAVHYNSRSIAPLDPSAPGTVDYYSAYRRFAALLREPRFQLKFKLADGEIVVFDNQRILHGRTAFSSARHPRHLRGCYLTRDSVYSAAAVLRRALDRGSGHGSH